MFKRISFIVLTSLVFPSAWAQGAVTLAEHQARLEQRLAAFEDAPFKGLQVELESSFEALNLRNDKREFGQLTTTVTNSPDGLQVRYPAEVIAMLNEGRRDETPSETEFAMEYFDVAELVDLFHPRDAIIERMQAGVLTAVESIPATAHLRFEFNLPLEALIDDEELRGYVNEFQASYHLTVTENYEPVSAELSFRGDGSAYFFFDVNAAGNSIEHYLLTQDYLFVSERTSSQDFESTFSERRFTSSYITSQTPNDSNAEQHSTANLNVEVPPLSVD